MTTTVATPVVDVLSRASSNTALDVVVVVLVILLLTERELMRAAGNRWLHRAQALSVAAVPLLSAFAVVVAARLAALL